MVADRTAGKGTLHLVSAWATRNRLVFGQVAADTTSHEITALPELLRMLAPEGCRVTIDAAGCQIALNLLRQEATTKAGVKAKRLKAGGNHAYLLQLPAG